MKSFTINLAHKLVDAIWRTATEPAPSGQCDEMVIVPYYHAIPYNRMNIHGVEQGDLRHIERQLRIRIWLGAKEPGQESLARDSL